MKTTQKVEMKNRSSEVDLTGVNWMEVPVFAEQPIFLENQKKHIPDYKAIVNQTSKEVASIRGEGYALVQHTDVLKLVVDSMKATQLKCEKATPHFTKEGSRMFCDIRFAKHDIEVAKGDIVQTGIRVINSVDGSTGVVISPFTYRLACTNGMTHQSILSKSIQYHRGNPQLLLKQMCSVMGEAVSSIEEIEKRYKHWMTVHFGLEILKKESIKPIVELVPKKYMEEIEEQKPTNKWQLFNILTDLNSHDERRNFNKVNKFDGVIEQLMAVV